MKDLIIIRDIVKEVRPEILHIQGIIHYEFEVPFYRFLKKYVKSICFTVHNILPHEAKKKDEKKLIRICNIANILIIHNESSKDLLLEHIGAQNKDKIFVIPHGCYTGYKVKTEKSNEKLCFLMFGLLRKYKGIDILLKAIKLLPEDIKEKCRFIIAGNQQKNYDNTDYIALRDELDLDNQIVEFDIRFIPDELVESYFNKSDCVIFPYREIYASGALLMAYSFEKPVIVSGIPVFVEETDNGKTGLIFNKNNEKDLADAIELFVTMDKKNREEFVENIVDLKNRKYSWDISARLTVLAYRIK